MGTTVQTQFGPAPGKQISQTLQFVWAAPWQLEAFDDQGRPTAHCIWTSRYPEYPGPLARLTVIDDGVYMAWETLQNSGCSLDVPMFFWFYNHIGSDWLMLGQSVALTSEGCPKDDPQGAGSISVNVNPAYPIPPVEQLKQVNYCVLVMGAGAAGDCHSRVRLKRVDDGKPALPSKSV